MLKALEDDDSRARTLAVHVLPRRELSSVEIERIRKLRNDPQHRPWVRMAALDTLAEIEREREAKTNDQKDAEQKAQAAKDAGNETSPLPAVP